MADPNLGIQRIHSLELCARDARPWADFLTEGFGFQNVAAGTDADVERTGTRRKLFRCRDVGLVLAEKVHAGSAVGRYLERHPEGIARVNFLVVDLKAAEEKLRERHATPIDLVSESKIDDADWKQMSIATPFGDVEFCFIECADPNARVMPGMSPAENFDPARDPIGLARIDHLTTNIRTVMPAVAFLEHVMGFTRAWDVAFHTEDFQPGVGTGLKSIVMEDPESGVKFANNEPRSPRFNESQVQVQIDANRGPGVHHLAFEVSDILAAVDHCRQQGVEFLPTPDAYYEALPGRIKSRGIGPVSQPLEELQSRGVLLDGDKNGYLLQVFCRDRCNRYPRPHAGPLILELVQRCGANGFGEGNFRALFEAMQQQD